MQIEIQSHTSHRASFGPSGLRLGVLLLDYHGPFVPGDVGNASSYPFPVVYRMVTGATSKRMFARDTSLLEPIIEASQALEAQGVHVITSDCGFFALYQSAVTAAVKIPVCLSSLMLLQTLPHFFDPSRPIGIITSNAGSLDLSLLQQSGGESATRLIIRGLNTEPYFGLNVTGACRELDTDRLQQEVVGVALAMLKAETDLSAILLECSMLPPYSHAIQAATGLPVFDFMSLVNFFCAGR